MNTAQITTRSKIAIRYTTNPANLGYDGTKTDWKNAKPDAITSPAKVRDFISVLKRNLGGAFFAVHLSNNGREVSMDEISDCIND